MAEEKEKEKETPKPGINVKAIAIMGVVLIVFAAGMAYGVAKLVMTSVAPGGGKVHEVEKNKTEVGFLMDVGEYTANITSESGSKYMKVKISLDLSDEKTTEELNTKMAKVQDTIISVLRSKTAEEMSDPKATEKLKIEIKDKINDFSTAGRVSDVYFTYFIVQ